jgi:hypothetical protein
MKDFTVFCDYNPAYHVSRFLEVLWTPITQSQYWLAYFLTNEKGRKNEDLLFFLSKLFCTPGFLLLVMVSHSSVVPFIFFLSRQSLGNQESPVGAKLTSAYVLRK